MNKPTGQLVQLSDYRKPKAEDERGYITIYLPAERDADLLFNAYHSDDSNVTYQIGCVLDEEINAASRFYEHRHIFTTLYLDAIKEGKSDALKFILRELRRGTPLKEVASHLDCGGLKEGGTQ